MMGIHCRHGRVCSRVLWILAMLAAAPTFAQTQRGSKVLTAERIKIIELRRDDPEVMAATRREASSASYLLSAAGDDRFLVDIDPARMNRANVTSTGQRKSSLFATDGGKRIAYDKPGQDATEFVVEYPSFNAQLRCYWAYDQRLVRQLAAAEAKAREQALHSATKGTLKVNPETDTPITEDAQVSSPEPRSLPLFAPEGGNLIRVRRQFKKGGRPCQLEVICQSLSHPRWKAFWGQGRTHKKHNACEARAKALVDAMVVVRAGR